MPIPSKNDILVPFLEILRYGKTFQMCCELDALYFHLYQIGRDDVDYIMETFPIVKRKDIAGMLNDTHPGLPHIGVYRTPSPGEEASDDEHLYVTKRIILDMYDQMAQLPTMAVPAPKDENSTYDVPDVSQWQTWLSPPPADSSVAHDDTRG